MKIFHSSFYQNYQMNLSDISIRYGKEMFVVFMYVKKNCSSEKSKSDKRSVYLFSEDETVEEKWIKAISNTNLSVS